MLRTKTARTLLIALAGSISLAAHAQADVQKVEIPPGELATALASLARQSSVELVYLDRDVEGIHTQGVVGVLSVQEAVTKLLEGTPLILRTDSSGAILIAPPAPKTPATDSSNSAIAVEEVVVTGSLIRGVADGPSPVIIVDREQIDRSGYATVAAALAALPQNFSGSAIEVLNNNGGERQGTNSHFGSGLNLRGLGSDATLVLVNGRRMGGAGSNAEFADISTIPTAAVERVELLMDGASALYGSDAVGGVVNIVLKKSYDGAETRLTSGAATRGEPFEGQFAQLFGRRWSGGSGLISYEYHERDALHSSDRDITRDADLRRLGGSDHRSQFSFPGNILRIDPATATNAPYWAIPAGQSGVGLQPGDFVGGTINLHNKREGVDVLPRQIRHSAYATARQALSDRFEISADVRYGYRKYAADASLNTAQITISQANPFFVSPSGATTHSILYAFAELPNARAGGSAESVGVSVGGEARLMGDWRAELYGAFARETGESYNTGLLHTIALGEALGTTPDRADTPFNPAVDGYFNPFAGQAANSAAVLSYIGGGYQRIHNRGTVRSLNLKADGSLFDLPAGPIKLAVGAQHREETFERGGENYTSTVAPVPATAVDVGRKIDAAFAEVRVPLFGAQNVQPGLQRLELSFAGRVERYSDFGWTQNPKAGLVLSPLDGVLFRASYGRSFRAPALRELSDPSTNSSSLLQSGSTRVGALIQSGGNPDLDPETADSFTAGIELQPFNVPGLTIGASWFDIQFEDRIDRPVQANILTALDDPNVSSFVRRISPATNAADRALIAALLADPATRTFLGPPEAYGAIVDSRYVNTASLRVSGVDLSTAYELAFEQDAVTIRASAAHLYRYEQRLTPTASAVDFVGVATYPLDWRARASVDWRRGVIGAGLAMNYVSNYHDALGTKINSLATVDLQLRFSGAESSRLEGLTATLNVRNLFDDGPPFYDNSAGVAFDPANGDPIGRFVSLHVMKAW